MRKNTFFLLLFLFLAVFISFPLIASAAATVAPLIDIWAGTGGGGGATCNVQGPCSFCDGLIVISNIIKILFKVAIPIAVGMIIYGAIRLMISAGNPKQISEASDIIKDAIIGLVIVLAAWMLVEMILRLLSGNGNIAPWSTLTCTP